MKPILVAIAVCLCLIPYVRSEEADVGIRVVPVAGPLQPGKTTVLNIELVIPPPYHINSDRPLQDYLIPTRLDFQPQPGLSFGQVVFPAAPTKKLPFSDELMAVYEGIVRVALSVTPAKNNLAKEITLKGSFRYQACNDQYCLRPVTKTFEMVLPLGTGSPVTRVAPKTEPKLEPQPKPGTVSQPPVAAPPRPSPAEGHPGVDFAGKGLLITFLLVFLGGLALNLTPCVYPMIPITITYFGGQAQGKKGSLVFHSVLYVIGMAVTYSILGVVAAMTGGLFGAAHQYPAVLIGIALVMVLLALSMFDVYELRMPQFMNRLAGSSQKGFAGTFLMGLTVGIVAAPCIGPFVLGLLTYVGNKGNAFLGFALFFVLALGMGIPFLFLGFFSGSIRKLPRSGAWMVWVRKVFGFILLAMAVYFLEPLFPTALAYRATLSLIMLLAGIYLAWIDNVPGSGKWFAFLRNGVGVAFFAVALYSAVTGLEANPGIGVSSMSQDVQWLPYSESVLTRAAQESKPVFIDFFAEWCAPCKELDKKTYSTPEVVARSKEFIMLKVDLTSTDNPQTEFLRKKYQARGVPTLVFLTPEGNEIVDLRGTGFEPKEVFLKKMNEALRLSARQP